MARRHIRRNKQQARREASAGQRIYDSDPKALTSAGKRKKILRENGSLDKLTSSAEVIHALGGLAPMAALTSKAAKRKVKTQHVWNWKAKGKLPPAYYLIHLRALHGKRYDAPAELWRIISLPSK